MSVIIKVVKETHCIRENHVSQGFINLYPTFFWLIVSRNLQKASETKCRGFYIPCSSYLQQKLRSFLLLHTFNERSETERVWHEFLYHIEATVGGICMHTKSAYLPIWNALWGIYHPFLTYHPWVPVLSFKGHWNLNLLILLKRPFLTLVIWKGYVLMDLISYIRLWWPEGWGKEEFRRVITNSGWFYIRSHGSKHNMTIHSTAKCPKCWSIITKQTTFWNS